MILKSNAKKAEKVARPKGSQDPVMLVKTKPNKKKV